MAILPLLGEENLYKSFNHDEPWDGPTNKPLIEKMPQVFASPGKPAPPGQTYLRAFVGPSAAMPAEGLLKGKPPAQFIVGRSMRDFPDGMSNTLWVAEASEPVVWTKPDDLPVPPPGQPGNLSKLGGPFPGGFHGLMVDGSVHWFDVESLTESALRALTTANASDAIPTEVAAILHPHPRPGAPTTSPTGRARPSTYPTTRTAPSTYPTARTRPTNR